MTDERSIEEFPYRYELVPLDRLFVDKKYQRKVSEPFIKKMVEDWRPHLVGTLAVSEREYQTTKGIRIVKRGAIVDGQSRWNAAKRLKLETIPCAVYSDLTRPEEAILFVDIQTRRRGTSSSEKFIAKLAGEDEEAIALNELVISVGYKIGNRNESPETIAAVRALEICFGRDEEVLERTLIAFHEAGWLGDRIPSAWHIRGLWRLLRDTGDSIDDERLIRRMFLAGPNSVYKRALNLKEGGGLGSQAEPYMAQAFKAVYSLSESKLQRAA